MHYAVMSSGHKANDSLNEIQDKEYLVPGFTSQLLVEETLMMFAFYQYLTRNLPF